MGIERSIHLTVWYNRIAVVRKWSLMSMCRPLVRFVCRGYVQQTTDGDIASLSDTDMLASLGTARPVPDNTDPQQDSDRQAKQF